MPGIASTAIFSFTFCWNEFPYAFVIITNDLQKTITVGLADLIVDDLYAWGPLMGGAVISTLPVVILYVCIKYRLQEFHWRYKGINDRRRINETCDDEPWNGI